MIKHQIGSILKEAEVGILIKNLRKYGMGNLIFYK